MNTEKPGLKNDPLFVGATRPPMRWGVSYSALLFNLVFTIEATKECRPPGWKGRHFFTDNAKDIVFFRSLRQS